MPRKSITTTSQKALPGVTDSDWTRLLGIAGAALAAWMAYDQFEGQGTFKLSMAMVGYGIGGLILGQYVGSATESLVAGIFPPVEEVV
jgi:hypothetical protein